MEANGPCNGLNRIIITHGDRIDLKDLAFNGHKYNTDITFQLRNGEQVYAIIGLLQVGPSALMRSMLVEYSSQLGKKNPTIDIEERVTTNSMKFFLLYMYSADTFEMLDESNVIEIYQLANTFMVPGLKEKCLNLLRQSVNAKRIVEWSIITYCENDVLFEIVIDSLARQLTNIVKHEPEILDMLDEEGPILKELCLTYYKKYHKMKTPEVIDLTGDDDDDAQHSNNSSETDWV